MAGDNLEALAAKGRDGGAAPAPGAPKIDREKFRRYLQERTVTDTFRQVHGSKVVPALAAVASLAAAIVLLATRVLLIGAPVIAVGRLVAAFVLNKLGEKRAIEAGLTWIEGLPFDFNGGDYLEGLKGQGMSTAVELELTFAEAPAEADRELFGSACAGAVATESRAWKGRTLSLSSGELSTYYPAQNGNESYYTNALPHRWVVTLVDKAVRSIHARAPLLRARIELVR